MAGGFGTTGESDIASWPGPTSECCRLADANILKQLVDALG